MNKFAWAVVAVLALSLVIVSGCRRDERPASAAGGSSIGVVDLGQVLRDTGLAASVESNIARARGEAEASLTKTRAVLVEKSEVLRKKLEPIIKEFEEKIRGGNLSTTLPEEGQKIRRQMAGLDVIFQRAGQVKQAQLQAYIQEINVDFRQQIEPALREVGKSKGVSAVLLKDMTVYTDPAYNLTAVLSDGLKAKTLPKIKEVPAEMAKEVDISGALKELELD